MRQVGKDTAQKMDAHIVRWNYLVDGEKVYIRWQSPRALAKFYNIGAGIYKTVAKPKRVWQ